MTSRAESRSSRKQLISLHQLQDSVAHTPPLHVAALQESPLQASALQVLAFQSPPDQDFASASSKAISAALNVEPMMSRSPSSTRPSIEMWSWPRASSSEPTPVEGTPHCMNVGSGAATAAESWSSPPPMA